MLTKHELSKTLVSSHGELCFSYGAYPLEIGKIDSTEKAYSIFRKVWDTRLINEQEEVYIIFVDGNNEYINHKLIHRGGTRTCTIDIPLILRLSLINKASGIFLAHNHPSGSSKPSQADNRITLELKMACDLINLVFLDHIVITDKSFYSFAIEGLL